VSNISNEILLLTSASLRPLIALRKGWANRKEVVFPVFNSTYFCTFFEFCQTKKPLAIASGLV